MTEALRKIKISNLLMLTVAGMINAFGGVCFCFAVARGNGTLRSFFDGEGVKGIKQHGYEFLYKRFVTVCTKGTSVLSKMSLEK